MVAFFVWRCAVRDAYRPACVRRQKPTQRCLGHPGKAHIVIALGLLAMLMFWGRGKRTQPQTEG